MKKKFLTLMIAFVMSCSVFFTACGVGGDAAVVLTGITVETKPMKTVYMVGDYFNSSGLEISAQYSDGTNKTLKPNEYLISAAHTSILNEETIKTVTITYIENGVTKTVTFEIRIGKDSDEFITETINGWLDLMFPPEHDTALAQDVRANTASRFFTAIDEAGIDHDHAQKIIGIIKDVQVKITEMALAEKEITAKELEDVLFDWMAEYAKTNISSSEISTTFWHFIQSLRETTIGLALEESGATAQQAAEFLEYFDDVVALGKETFDTIVADMIEFFSKNQLIINAAYAAGVFFIEEGTENTDPSISIEGVGERVTMDAFRDIVLGLKDDYLSTIFNTEFVTAWGTVLKVFVPLLCSEVNDEYLEKEREIFMNSKDSAQKAITGLDPNSATYDKDFEHYTEQYNNAVESIERIDGYLETPGSYETYCISQFNSMIDSAVQDFVKFDKSITAMVAAIDDSMIDAFYDILVHGTVDESNVDDVVIIIGRLCYAGIHAEGGIGNGADDLAVSDDYAARLTAFLVNWWADLYSVSIDVVYYERDLEDFESGLNEDMPGAIADIERFNPAAADPIEYGADIDELFDEDSVFVGYLKTEFIGWVRVKINVWSTEYSTSAYEKNFYSYVYQKTYAEAITDEYGAEYFENLAPYFYNERCVFDYWATYDGSGLHAFDINAPLPFIHNGIELYAVYKSVAA